MDGSGHRAYNYAEVVDYCPEQQQPHYAIQSDWELNPSFPLNFPDPPTTSQHFLDGFIPHSGSGGSGGSGFVLANQALQRSEIPNGFQDLGFFGSFLTTIGTEACSDAVQSFHLAAAGLSAPGSCWNASSSSGYPAQFPYETGSSSLSSEELAVIPDGSDGNLAVLTGAAAEGDDSCHRNAAEYAGSSLEESKDFFDGGGAATAGDNKATVFHRGKKGLPAKNLMAERRRRKKLNDRLYTLRSIVPKISKMDRTSILGDAIEYLKELQQRIEAVYTDLQNPTLSYAGRQKFLFEDELQASVAYPTEVDVQTCDGNAINISMLCEQRPGLLLSTMRALDGLGVDVQEADISFANGFRLRVCAEQLTKEHVRPEEIKAVLLHTAGYFNPAMLPC